MTVRMLVPLALFAAAVAGVAAYHGYDEARRDPVVRHVRLNVPRWPAGTPPIKLVLIGDVHFGNAAMDAARLDRIVSIANRLRPDLYLVAGDLVSGRGGEQARRAATPVADALRRLRAPLGVVAVLGNHDHETDAALLARVLRQAGVTVLVNQAVERGPLAIGGLDDPVTGRDRIGPTIAAMRRLPGAPFVLAHSPRPIWHLPKDGTVLLAGHTHCGQIVVPLLWRWMAKSPDFRCGVIRDRNRVTIVTAGLGTSRVPMRLGAPPDLWLITIGSKPNGPG